MKKGLKGLLLVTAIATLITVPSVAYAEELVEGNENSSVVVATIGDATYASLDEAYAAAQSGDTIKINGDYTLSKLYAKDITFEGTGSITVSNYSFGLGNSLTVKGDIEFNWIGSNGGWLLLSIGKTGSLNILDGAKFNMEFDSTTGATVGIYTVAGSRITVDNGSSFEILGANTKGVTGNGIQGESGVYYVTVTNNSSYKISGVNRGMAGASPLVTVTDSTFEIVNCTANALNGGTFNFTNSEINVSENNGHGLSTTVLNVVNSNVKTNNNLYFGTYASSSLAIDGTSTLITTGNGKGFTGGGLYTKGTATVKSGAVVTITGNQKKGYHNNGAVATFEDGVILTIQDNEAEMGAGVYNVGTLVLPVNAVINNNKATNAADDIYNKEGASITFGTVASKQSLNDCGDKITAWFDDNAESRWESHSEDEEGNYIEVVEAGTYTTELTIKAAHSVDDLKEEEKEPTTVDTPETGVSGSSVFGLISILALVELVLAKVKKLF